MSEIFFYLGGDELHSGQYIALVNSIRANGQPINLILPFKTRFYNLFFLWNKKKFIGPNLITINKSSDDKFYLVPLFLGLPVGSNFIFKIFLIIVIWYASLGFNKIIIHSKLMNDYAYMIKKILGRKRVKIICEFEGDFVSEKEYSINKTLNRQLNDAEKKTLIKEIKQERKMLSEVDKIVCVTKKLKEVIAKRHKELTLDDSKFFIFESLASRNLFYFDINNRIKAREELSLNDYTIIIYSGNLNCAWQIPDKLAALFKEIKKIKSNSFFLIITKNSDRNFILPYLIKYEISDYKFLQVPHSDINKYLCAADYGLILREKNIMNEVATPGKFAEYALCGLPIIMTKGIGEYSEMIKGNKYSFVIDDITNIDQEIYKLKGFFSLEIKDIDRFEFSNWCTSKFSIEKNIPSLINTYKGII